MKTKLIFVACMAIAGSLAQASGAQAASAPSAPAPSAPTAEPSVLNFLAPDHATIRVQNMDIEREWYIHVFGAIVLRTVNNPTSQMVMLQIPGYRFDLLKAQDSGNAPLTQPKGAHLGWTHVDFSLPPEEIESAYAVLKARGTDVKPSGAAIAANKEHAGKIWLIGLHDPEGNEIEIVARDYY